MAKSAITSKIESAVKVTEEKLKIGMVQGDASINGKKQLFEGMGKKIEFVAERVGSKIRMPVCISQDQRAEFCSEKCLNQPLRK